MRRVGVAAGFGRSWISAVNQVEVTVVFDSMDGFFSRKTAFFLRHRASRPESNDEQIFIRPFTGRRRFWPEMSSPLASIGIVSQLNINF